MGFVSRLKLASLATLFGLGKSPWAPGTLGSLVTLPLAWILTTAGPLVYLLGIVVLFPLAVWSAQAYESQSQSHDCKCIIIDEVLGMLITLFWLPLTWQSFALGFLFFRILDVLKPYPISYLDRKVPGGVGVVLDDVAAGIVANIALQILAQETTLLGIQAVTFTS